MTPDGLIRLRQALARRRAAALGTTAVTVTEGDPHEVLSRMAPAFVDLLDSHAALLDLIGRAGLNTSWAQDRVTLEAAQALQDRLSPRGPTT